MSRIKSESTGAQRFDNEAKDCTVRALANAAGMPYKLAHRIMSKAGRKQGKGMYFEPLHDVYSRLGFRLLGVYGDTKEAKYIGRFLQMDRQQGMTLAKAMNRLQQGRYIVKVSGHVFAVVDGKVLDYGDNPAGSRVQALYRLEQQAVLFDQ